MEYPNKLVKHILSNKIFNRTKSITLLAIPVTLMTACDVISPSIQFNPPEGHLPSATTVELTQTGFSQIYVTTDGTQPTTGCDVFTPDTEIHVDQNLQVKVLGVIGDNEVLYTATYTVPDGEPQEHLTNEEAISAWENYLVHVQDEVFAIPNAEQGIWHEIEDGMGGTVKAKFDISVRLVNLFESEVTITYLLRFDGYTYGGLTIDGDPGSAPDSYAEIENHAVIRVKTLTGDFVSSRDEYIRSNNRLHFSGDYNGYAEGDFSAVYVNDSIIIDGGNYTISCSDNGCAPNGQEVVYAFVEPGVWNQITEVNAFDGLNLISCNAADTE